MSENDSELLAAYVRDGDHAAFAALVARHLDLVYSAACRQTGSASLAEEVAQSVFIQLARRAATIKPGTPLVAWLHVVTRRMAINAVRNAMRRQMREHRAGTDPALSAMNLESSSPPWSAVEPLLDEAVESLPETDRAAILLRFFENKSLREVGAALGTSDDAAQKRVSRAIEQLRTFFFRRGIVVTAAGLASDLSAHALVSAPAGLAVSFASTAVIAAKATAAASATLMTTTQKSVFTTAFALVLGFGAYEVTVFFRQNGELCELRQQADYLAAQLERTRSQQASSANYRETVEREISVKLTARAEADASVEAQIRAQLAKVDQLKQLAAANPQLCIPEMALLTADEWFTTAQNPNPDQRRLFAGLRKQAAQHMAERIREALTTYLLQNNHILPNQVSQLLPFMGPSVEAEWLDRYAMNQSGKLDPNEKGSNLEGIISQRVAPIDLELDQIWGITPHRTIDLSARQYNFLMALNAFAAANPGQTTATVAQIMPLLRWPMPEEELRRYLPWQGRVRVLR